MKSEGIMTHSASEATLSPAGIERIQTAMNRYITEKKVPGMLVAVERSGKTANYVEDLQAANLDNKGGHRLSVCAHPNQLTSRQKSRGYSRQGRCQKMKPLL